MGNGNGGSGQPEPTDAELLAALAAGREEPLRALYARHAPVVFAVARQSLDRAAAEEIVQDVFVAVWRHAAEYDPARGAFRPWALRIAQRRILNELRRRSRRPAPAGDPDDDGVSALPDPDPGPSTAVWREYQRGAVRAALEHLPAAQRQALGLAFFDELTHEQVAAVLGLRLGTAKTRIRSAMRRLREHLAPLVALLAAVLVATTLALARHERGALHLDERALDLVTSSDVLPLRLAAVGGTPPDAHANYRARPGSTVAVLSLSHLPPVPPGSTYQAWLRRADRWLSLGTARPGRDGRARIIAEGAHVAEAPEALEVTLEPIGGSAAPTGTVVVAWPKP